MVGLFDSVSRNRIRRCLPAGGRVTSWVAHPRRVEILGTKQPLIPRNGATTKSTKLRACPAKLEHHESEGGTEDQFLMNDDATGIGLTLRANFASHPRNRQPLDGLD